MDVYPFIVAFLAEQLFFVRSSLVRDVRASMKVKSLQRVLDEAGCGEDGVSLRQYLQQQQQQREGSANVAANYVTVCAGPSSQPRRQAVTYLFL